jgi:hypothetical protein
MVMWGKYKENGVWWGSTSKWRVIWNHHDAFYLAAGKLRIRIMKVR